MMGGGGGNSKVDPKGLAWKKEEQRREAPADGVHTSLQPHRTPGAP